MDMDQAANANAMRKAPPAVLAKYRAWRTWQTLHHASHFIVGSLIAALSVVVAANTKLTFLSQDLALVLSVAVAVLAFASTTLQSQLKASACERAAREIEKAIAIYEADPSKNEKYLADAQVRGIEILSGTKG